MYYCTWRQSTCPPRALSAEQLHAEPLHAATGILMEQVHRAAGRSAGTVSGARESFGPCVGVQLLQTNSGLYFARGSWVVQ